MIWFFFQGACQGRKGIDPWCPVDGCGLQETEFSAQHGLYDVSINGRVLGPLRVDGIVGQAIPFLVDLGDGCALGQVGQDVKHHPVEPVQIQCRKQDRYQLFFLIQHRLSQKEDRRLLVVTQMIFPDGKVQKFLGPNEPMALGQIGPAWNRMRAANQFTVRPDRSEIGIAHRPVKGSMDETAEFNWVAAAFQEEVGHGHQQLLGFPQHAGFLNRGQAGRSQGVLMNGADGVPFLLRGIVDPQCPARKRRDEDQNVKTRLEAREM